MVALRFRPKTIVAASFSERWRALSTFVALCGALLAVLPARGRSSRRPLPVLELRLRIRVAQCGGKPAQTAAWVDQHVAATQAIYRAHGIELKAIRERFEPDKCELLTRADRDGAARFAQPAKAAGFTIPVLVYPRVRDVDVLDYDLKGVHWRCRRGPHRGSRWIFLTARAKPPVLAHELGHYLGLPHDPRGGNLMAPGPSDPIYRTPGAVRPKPWTPSFTPRQAARLRRAARKLVSLRP